MISSIESVSPGCMHCRGKGTGGSQPTRLVDVARSVSLRLFGVWVAKAESSLIGVAVVEVASIAARRKMNLSMIATDLNLTMKNMEASTSFTYSQKRDVILEVGENRVCLRCSA